MITETIADFKNETTTFRPTNCQIEESCEYLKDTGLSSIIVAVSFPGMQSGEWKEGLVGLTVMEGSFMAVWIDNESAEEWLNKSPAGTVLFRIWDDGCYKVVDTK